MVAPHTRAERPAESIPAARPARKASRRTAPDGTDGSPPKRTRAKANGAGPNGAASNGAAASARPAPKPARTSTPRPRKDSPAALGEAVVASILRHDPDADVATI